MLKQISILAIISAMTLPAAATAGPQQGKSTEELSRRIEELAHELDELKAQLAKQGEQADGTAEEISGRMEQVSGKVEGMNEKVAAMDSKVGEMEEKSAAMDWASRFKVHGDFRARFDAYSASGADFFNLSTGQKESHDYSNDTMLTNRFRLNMEAKATEYVTFKGRLAMYKAWGMESYPRNDMNSWWPQFDGNSTRTPSDNALRVDRAFVNWTEIGGLPIWFSIGRRPTTDGPPAELRLGTGKKMATAAAYMDYPFDGLSLGYAYDWGNDALGTGLVRFCYGRGFESGLQWDAAAFHEGTNIAPLDDTDFTGISWDVLTTENRFLYLQSFAALNMFQRPAFLDDDFNADANHTEGNIYHTSTVYESRFKHFSYFAAGGWSRTDPGGSGMFNDYATASLMQADGSFSPNPDWQPNSSAENGFSLYAGLRYDIPDTGLKIGAEYNWGSQYWIAFNPGHDDMYLSKLATRGHVAELYMLYDLPTGEALSQYAKTYLRLGWQHYWYDYTGVDWNVRPYDLDDAQLMTAYMMMASEKGMLQPVDSANQVYLTFDVFF